MPNNCPTTWSLAILLLIVGALIAGIIRVIAHCLRLWHHRRAVGKALLREIQACCRRAARLAHTMDLNTGHVDVLKKQYILSLQTPFWDGALKELSQLPPKDMCKLVEFYSFVTSINSRLDAFKQEQNRFERWGKQGDPDRRMGTSMVDALTRMAHTLGGMSGELAMHQDVKRIQDLPDRYRDEYAFADTAQGQSGSPETPLAQ